MAGNPYASSHGRLRVEFTGFLPRDLYARLLSAHDVDEMAKTLDGSAYALDLDLLRASHQGIALLERAINRTLVRRNQRAYAATPFAGRRVVAAYLERWDIENISLILSAKAKNLPVSETERELVSSRDAPAGLIGGRLTLDDFRLLLEQPTVEAVANQLVKYGYGASLLPLVEEYQRSLDIFPLLHALTGQYYRGALGASRYFQGDEWVVRRYLEGEIDQLNVLLLLKGKDSGLPIDRVLPRALDGGDLGPAALSEAYAGRSVPEVVERLAPRYPSLSEGNEEYARSASLTVYDAAIQRDRAVAEAKRMRAYPLSLAGIFTYLFLAELERADLRRIAFGKVYGVPPERISPLIVSSRL